MGFFASKGLQTFHALAAPYVNTVETAGADSQQNVRRPTAESPETTGVD